jgi:membrane associated rhomboid family serine protease/Zn-finger nucleic acid-binding protein
MAQLRKAIPPETVNTLWQLARTGEFPRKRLCPGCDRPMTEVPVPVESGGQWLDVCTRCLFVWFDPGEYEALPQVEESASVSPDQRLPLEAREKMALMKLDTMREQEADSALPSEWWKQVLAFLGMPIEYNTRPLARTPWLTWLTAAVIVAVSVLAFMDLERAVAAFGLIPAEFGRLGGLTLLTSFFLHGGIFHLLGNVYFLLVFGDNVEDDLGKGRFLLLLLLSTLVGDACHVLAQPHSTMPCVGASGGISGVIAYYALKFPQAKVGILFRYFVYFKWVRFSALAMFGIWIVLQIFGAWTQLAGVSNVAALAHLGGAAVGFFFWLARRGK